MLYLCRASPQSPAASFHYPQTCFPANSVVYNLLFEELYLIVGHHTCYDLYHENLLHNYDRPSMRHQCNRFSQKPENGVIIIITPSTSTLYKRQMFTSRRPPPFLLPTIRTSYQQRKSPTHDRSRNKRDTGITRLSLANSPGSKGDWG